MILVLPTMKKIIYFLLIGAILPTLMWPQTVNASAVTSIGVATHLPVQGDRIEDGDIVVATIKGYFLSRHPYEPQLAGVITMHPAIVLKTSTQKNTYPVINVGSVNVKVAGVNGDIKKGDYIASSNLPGTGMKATKSGYVLGNALEDVKFSSKTDVKLIPLTLNMHFLQLGNPVRSSLLDIFTLSKIATYEQPVKVFQYVVAAFIVVASFTTGFLIFAKVVNTGIQAIGRNPLAGRMIQLSIVFNVGLIIIILMTGIIMAYIILNV